MIKDIEFRIVSKTIDDPTMMIVNMIIHTFQYRKKIMLGIEVGTEWTTWIDIPVVYE